MIADLQKELREMKQYMLTNLATRQDVADLRTAISTEFRVVRKEIWRSTDDVCNQLNNAMDMVHDHLEEVRADVISIKKGLKLAAQ